MGRNDECFCGSKIKYKRCHSHINENSFIANLYRLQNEIDQEIEKQKGEKKLEFECKKGCIECCSQYFCVSESEFILIFDYIIKNWEMNKVEDIIDKCKEQWWVIKKDYPGFAEILKENITGKDKHDFLKTIMFNPSKLPFPCVFLDKKDNSCSIYKVRPLICRVHGISIIDSNNDNEPCSKIKSILENKDRLVNLEKYYDEIFRFIFIKDNDNRVIVRRPFPLFYFFNYVFEDGMIADKFTETLMYNRMISYDEKTYIKNLFKSYSAYLR